MKIKQGKKWIIQFELYVDNSMAQNSEYNLESVFFLFVQEIRLDSFFGFAGRK